MLSICCESEQAEFQVRDEGCVHTAGSASGERATAHRSASAARDIMATGFARPLPPWAASRAIALGIPKREWNIEQPDPSGNTPPPPKDTLWWRANRNAAPVPGPNPLRKVFPRHLPPGWQDVKTNLLDDGKADVKARFGWGVSAPGDEPAAAKGVGAAADTKHQPKAQGKGMAAKVKGGKASGVPKKKAAVARKPAAKATREAVGAGARAAARAAAGTSAAEKGPEEWSSGGSTDQGSSDSDDGPTPTMMPTSPPASPPSSTPASTFRSCRHSVERCTEHSDGCETLRPPPPVCGDRWMPAGPTLEA